MNPSLSLDFFRQWVFSKPGQTRPEVIFPVDESMPTIRASEDASCPGYQVGTGTILYQRKALIGEVYDSMNLPDDLQILFQQTLERLTDWMHLLPAHPLHHCEPFGALRHALETAYWSSMAMRQIHTDHTLDPGQRRAREPLWRLIAGVAGLLHDSGRVASCITVHDEYAGQWESFHQSLGSWLQKYQIDCYTPQWHEAETNPDQPIDYDHASITLLLLDRLMSDDLRYALSPDQDDGALWQTFINAITGKPYGKNCVVQLVHAVAEARLKSVKLHFMKGKSLSNTSQPETPHQPQEANEPDQAMVWLESSISRLNSDNIKWLKGSLLILWPDAVENLDGLPEPDAVLSQWNQQGWIRPFGNRMVFRRNGHNVIALQPTISKELSAILESADQF